MTMMIDININALSAILYLQVYGKIQEYDGYERFEWRHSYSRIYKPMTKYTPQGLFMSFEHYNVEVRDRVKCISGIEGQLSLLYICTPLQATRDLRIRQHLSVYPSIHFFSLFHLALTFYMVYKVNN